MITLAEMMKTAVWLRYDDAFRVCMCVASAKLNAMVVPHYTDQPDYSLIHDGYSIISFTHDREPAMNTLTMGVVAALCQRHDLPPDTRPDKEKGIGGERHGPRFDMLPEFDAVPAEGVAPREWQKWAPINRLDSVMNGAVINY